ncbi:hypothetical protein [Microbacterium luteolum]
MNRHVSYTPGSVTMCAASPEENSAASERAKEALSCQYPAYA